MFRQVFFVAAVIVVALAHKHEWSEEDKKIHDECAKELGFDLSKPQKGQKPSLEDKKKFSCMMKCAGIKNGIISQDGALNADKIQEKFNVDAEKVKAALEACKDKTGDDDCTKISNKVRCVIHKIYPRKQHHRN